MSIAGIFIAGLLLSCSVTAGSSNLTIYVLTENKGVMVSRDDGRTWDSFNEGLPASFAPLKMYEIKSGNNGQKYLYLTTKHSGLFRIGPGNGSWISVSSADFRRRSQYLQGPGFRKISAFSADPSSPEIITLATKHDIYVSRDSGTTWSKATQKGIGNRNYITALAIHGGLVLAGSSVTGVYISNGGAFTRRTAGLPREQYSQGMYFTGEFSSMAMDPASEKIYGGMAFGKGLYVSSDRGKTWSDMKVPLKNGSFKSLCHVTVHGGMVYAAAGKSGYKYDPRVKTWFSVDYGRYLSSLPEGAGPVSALVTDRSGNYPPMFFQLKKKTMGKGRGANKRALYASIPAVRKKLSSLISTMKSSGLNAMVIDMKDDFGRIFYPTNNAAAREIGAVRRPIDLKALLKKLHENDIHAIARIPVFKDEKLFKGYGMKYAIINVKTGRPWQGNSKEYWVDPHAEFVQQYNIDLALELEKSGFDEIQFDYIRFPSDGPVHLCGYRFRTEKDMYKSEILSDFLMKAKKSLTVPVSTDIYGFNSWYSFGNWIGQDMEAFSEVVDVICPLVYPSHFGNRYYMDKGPRSRRPYLIVYDGGMRANEMVSGTVLRPYLQAFRMMSPTWGPGYIQAQVKGAIDSGQSGYTFWNARGDYDMVREALTGK